MDCPASRVCHRAEQQQRHQLRHSHRRPRRQWPRRQHPQHHLLFSLPCLLPPTSTLPPPPPHTHKTERHTSSPPHPYPLSLLLPLPCTRSHLLLHTKTETGLPTPSPLLSSATSDVLDDDARLVIANPQPNKSAVHYIESSWSAHAAESCQCSAPEVTNTPYDFTEGTVTWK